MNRLTESKEAAEYELCLKRAQALEAEYEEMERRTRAFFGEPQREPVSLVAAFSFRDED